MCVWYVYVICGMGGTGSLGAFLVTPSASEYSLHLCTYAPLHLCYAPWHYILRTSCSMNCRIEALRQLLVPLFRRIFFPFINSWKSFSNLA
mmetsp:Transcript_1692/g.3692  ORF Transcript_1692/g.3692 Transcript_1692/m.3692 type:complete len:91 (-) Transcript_1692:423-695(-)